MTQQRSSISLRIIASLLFAMMLIASLIPINAFANGQLQTQADEASGECGNCTWTISDTGVLSIEAKSGTDGTLASFEDNPAPWTFPSHSMQITAAAIGSDVIANGNLAGMFSMCENMKSVDLSKMVTINATNMGNMFGACKALEEINLSGIETGNVTAMNGMFSGCESLTSIDVSGFDTSKVESMMRMFNDCKSLTKLDLSHFNTESVTNISGMFDGCDALEEVTIGSKFSFKDKDGNICTLPGEKWLSKADNKVYTVAEIAENHSGEVTYVKDGTPVSEDDPNDEGESTNPSDKDNQLVEEDVIIYRLYNPYNGEHLFTKNESEYDFLGTIGWQQEDVAWYAPTAGEPVYRLYNPYSGDHFFTTNKDEYDFLATLGWRQEGLAWYAGGTQPVYRLFNPYATVGTHLFTTNKHEYDFLGTIGWKQEDVGMYALSA